MTSALFLGMVLAAGVLVALSGLFPARVSLATALQRVHQPRAPRVAVVNGASLWTRLVGVPLATTPIGSGVQRRFAADLRAADVQIQEVVAKMALAFLVGLIWAPAVAGLMALGDVHLSWVLPAWGALVLGICGAAIPLLGLRTEAARRRQAFRHALSCFLDLVSVRLAGGAGVDGALNDGAEAGQGWAFAEIRQALVEARLMGEPPWTGLARLGEELDIPVLGELAASTALAGGEGARVRASLAAKARSIRTKGLADAEAAAQSASERMSLPVVLLMLGFVAFLGYPAVMQVFTGL